MFAVIRTGGKQYRVAPEDIIEIEKIAGDPGDIVQLGEVLMLGGEGAPKTGSPTVSGASVAAEVLEQKRDEKIIVFKKKRRQGYRRTKGHRQRLTALRITEILTDGRKPSKSASKPAGAKADKKDDAPAKKAPAKTADKAEAKQPEKTEQAPAQKAAAKKAPEEKTPAKKAAAKKAPAKKAPAKKTAAKKAPAKKAPAKKKS